MRLGRARRLGGRSRFVKNSSRQCVRFAGTASLGACSHSAGCEQFPRLNSDVIEALKSANRPSMYRRAVRPLEPGNQMSGFRQGRVATEPAARIPGTVKGRNATPANPCLRKRVIPIRGRRVRSAVRKSTTTKLSRSWQCGTSEKTTTTEQPQSGPAPKSARAHEAAVQQRRGQGPLCAALDPLPSLADSG